MDDITSDLIEEPLESLMERASARRDGATGSRVTYSPKVFIPLTIVWVVVIGAWMQSPFNVWH